MVMAHSQIKSPGRIRDTKLHAALTIVFVCSSRSACSVEISDDAAIDKTADKVATRRSSIIRVIMVCISLLTVVVYGITSSLIHHASTPSRQSYMLLLFRLIGFYVYENTIKASTCVTFN